MKSKKVFVVKNFKSPYIEEAIFILREDAPSAETLPDAVLEAERIIAGYLSGLDAPRIPKKRTKRRMIALSLSLMTALALLIFFL